MGYSVLPSDNPGGVPVCELASRADSSGCPLPGQKEILYPEKGGVLWEGHPTSLVSPAEGRHQGHCIKQNEPDLCFLAPAHPSPPSPHLSGEMVRLVAPNKQVAKIR